MAERQQALARRRSCEDPAVASLSSFIGVDGTNATLNSGRMLINLKPLGERGASASDVIRRLQPELAAGRGHHALHAAGAGPDDRGPREPHAVPVHAGGRGRGASSRTWAPQARRRAAQRAAARATSRSDQQDRRPAGVRRDRPRTAARLGITPARSTTRSTTPSASGWSRRSSRSQPVPRRARSRSPSSSTDPAALDDIYVPSSASGGQPGRCRSSRSTAASSETTRAARDQPPRPVSGGRRSRSTSRRAPSLGDAVKAIEAAQQRARRCRRASQGSFQGAALAFRASLDERAAG